MESVERRNGMLSDVGWCGFKLGSGEASVSRIYLTAEGQWNPESYWNTLSQPAVELLTVY